MLDQLHELGMTKITLKSLVADYMRSKMKDDDWGSVIFRPIAIVVAFPLARLGVSPMAVTIAAYLLLPIIAIASVVTTPPTALLVVCMLGILYCVLDCVDGTLARALKRESKFGYYADLSSDLLYRPVIYSALGHITDRITHASKWTWLSLALAAAWLALFARVSRLYKEMLKPRKTSTDRHAAINKKSVLEVIYNALSGIDILLPFISLTLYWWNVLPQLIVWLLIYSAADAVYSQTMTMLDLRSR